ncbi:MAG: peptidase M49, partial [Calditrichaeota bacterium]
ANAITVLTATGGAGPIAWAGINLPNAQEIREKYGSKSFLLTNIIEAGEAVRGTLAAEEFLSTAKERQVVKKYAGPASLAFVAMHEVLGHASGKVSPQLQGDPSLYLREYYSTIEEARADLVALWNIADPLCLKKGIIPDRRSVEALYRAYAMRALVQLAQVEKGHRLEEDHSRGRQMIVKYVAEKNGAIRFIKKNGKHYYRVADIHKMRQGLGELLAQLMRIKATGDYAAAKKLVETYGISFDPRLREEVVARARGIHYPNFVANVTPILRPRFNAGGEIVAIDLEYPLSLAKEMLDFRHQNQPEPKTSIPRVSAD